MDSVLMVLMSGWCHKNKKSIWALHMSCYQYELDRQAGDNLTTGMPVDTSGCTHVFVF